MPFAGTCCGLPLFPCWCEKCSVGMLSAMYVMTELLGSIMNFRKPRLVCSAMVEVLGFVSVRWKLGTGVEVVKGYLFAGFWGTELIR